MAKKTGKKAPASKKPVSIKATKTRKPTTDKQKLKSIIAKEVSLRKLVGRHEDARLAAKELGKEVKAARSSLETTIEDVRTGQETLF